MITAAWASMQFSVVHRLPGRLRLSIPKLQLVPSAYHPYVADTETLLAGLPGMQIVTINCGAASALIRYEPRAVSETLVLHWVERLITAAIQFYRQLNHFANNHLRILKTRLLLKEEVRRITKDHADTQ